MPSHSSASVMLSLWACLWSSCSESHCDILCDRAQSCGFTWPLVSSWTGCNRLCYKLEVAHPGRAAAAKLLQSCPTLCDPIDGSPPGSPLPGILQQEHWSGLPFPPVHDNEKWKWSRSVVSDFSWLPGLQPTRLLRPWDFPGKSTGVGCHCLRCQEELRTSYSRPLFFTVYFWSTGC